MSALAIQTALHAATMSPLAHGAGGEFSSGFSFADALTGLDKSTKDDKSRKSETPTDVDASNGTAEAAAPPTGADASDPAQTLAAALAAFANSNQATGVDAVASPQSTDPNASDTPRVRLPLGPMALSAAAAAPTSTLFSAIASAGSDTSPAVFDLTGAVPLQRQLSADPTLGFQSLQARTHLAVAEALPIRTQSSATNSLSSAASATREAASGVSTQSGVDAAISATSDTSQNDAAASMNLAGTSAEGNGALSIQRQSVENDGITATSGRNKTWGAEASTRGTNKTSPWSRTAGSSSTSHTGTSGATWNNSVSETVSNGAPGGRSSGNNGSSQTSSGGTASAAAPDSSELAVTAMIADPLSEAAATPLSLSVGQLPEFVADQASELSAEVSNASSSATATPGVRAPQAVKELDIELNPGDLGAVKLQMRLVNGKLSVVISVSNPKTLAAIEGERDSITGRLGGSQQELEELTIRRQPDFGQASNANGSESNSNRDSGRSNAQSSQSDGRETGDSSSKGGSTSSSGGSPSGGSGSFDDFMV